jgi:hypothetical protein
MHNIIKLKLIQLLSNETRNLGDVAFNQQSFVTSPCHLGLKSMEFFITVGDIDKLKEQQVLGNRSSLSATLLFWVLSFRGITTSRWKSLSPLAVLPHLFEFSHKNRCKREHHIKIIGWRKHQLIVTVGNKRNNKRKKRVALTECRLMALPFYRRVFVLTLEHWNWVHTSWSLLDCEVNAMGFVRVRSW